MKIIGTTGDGNYIAEVSHTEIEKVFDKYYGNLSRLKAGDDVDLGAGHDYRDCIKRACGDMVDASRQFAHAQSTLMRFSLMISQLPDPEAGEVAEVATP